MSESTAASPADVDPQETREWLEALDAVIVNAGEGRAHYLLEQLIALGHRAGINIPYSATTDYINTIPSDQQPTAPGDYQMEHTIRAYTRCGRWPRCSPPRRGWCGMRARSMSRSRRCGTAT